MLVWWIILIDFQVLSQPCVLGIKHKKSLSNSKLHGIIILYVVKLFNRDGDFETLNIDSLSIYLSCWIYQHKVVRNILLLIFQYKIMSPFSFLILVVHVFSLFFYWSGWGFVNFIDSLKEPAFGFTDFSTVFPFLLTSSLICILSFAYIGFNFLFFSKFLMVEARSLIWDLLLCYKLWISLYVRLWMHPRNSDMLYFHIH